VLSEKLILDRTSGSASTPKTNHF